MVFLGTGGDRQRGHSTSLTNTPAGSFSTSSFAPLLLSPTAHHSPYTLLLSLSLSLSFSLLHSTAFIIKIKCKIVPRTSFPNGIKLRAALFPYAITILVEGSILRLDHVVPLHTIVPSRANEQAVIYFI